MRFDEVLESITAVNDEFSAFVPEDWGQGRSCFGGLQTALAVAAMRRLVPEQVPLRCIQTTFLAPVPPGTCRIHATVLRTGRSATHVEAKLYDGDQPVCLVVAVFGTSRPSAIDIPHPPLKIAIGPEQAREVTYVPNGPIPTFFQHLRFRWAEGGVPFSGAKEAKTRVYVEIRDALRFGEAHAIALADSIPTPGLSLFAQPTPASSLTWMLEFLTDDYATGPEPWLIDAEVTSGRDGYLSQTAVLWNADGKAVCTSRQTVVVFG